MFKFIKKIFISTMIYFGSLSNVNPLKRMSLNNQECKVRPEIVNVNRDEPVFYPFSIKTSKCSGSCNNINYPHAKICVPDIVKNLNVKVFNLIPRTKETRHIELHETCKCECKHGENVCNNKQRWNKDKRRCECKELIDKSVCDKGFMWNPSNCECECDKSCDVGEYLDYENCECWKKLIDKLVEECTENIDEVKVTRITQDKNKHKYSSCVVYKVLFCIFFIFFIINIGTGTYFIYYKYASRYKENVPKYDYTY